MQFGTDTHFSLTPVSVKKREIHRDTFGTSTFLADEESAVMVKDYLDLATYATDENSGSFLYTDMESRGGNMRLNLSTYKDGAWQQPVTVLATGGAIASYDLLTLSNDKILITYNLISKDEMYSTFPDSETRYTVGSIVEGAWVEESSGLIAQLSDSYAFASDLVGNTNPKLICRTKGGAGSAGFDIVAYKWNGAGFGAAEILKENVSGSSFSVAARGDKVIAVYIDGNNRLHALSLTNSLTDTVVAEGVGGAAAITADAKRLLPGLCR